MGRKWEIAPRKATVNLYLLFCYLFYIVHHSSRNSISSSLFGDKKIKKKIQSIRSILREFFLPILNRKEIVEDHISSLSYYLYVLYHSAQQVNKDHRTDIKSSWGGRGEREREGKGEQINPNKVNLRKNVIYVIPVRKTNKLLFKEVFSK